MAGAVTPGIMVTRAVFRTCITFRPGGHGPSGGVFHFCVDFLLADFLGDVFRPGDGFGIQPHPLHRFGVLLTTGSSACSVTSYSSSRISGPLMAASRFASVIGSRSITTSSWLTGTCVVTVSVTVYFRSRARPVSWLFGTDVQLLLRTRHGVIDAGAGAGAVRKARGAGLSGTGTHA